MEVQRIVHRLHTVAAFVGDRGIQRRSSSLRSKLVGQRGCGRIRQIGVDEYLHGRDHFERSALVCEFAIGSAGVDPEAIGLTFGHHHDGRLVEIRTGTERVAYKDAFIGDGIGLLEVDLDDSGSHVERVHLDISHVGIAFHAERFSQEDGALGLQSRHIVGQWDAYACDGAAHQAGVLDVNGHIIVLMLLGSPHGYGLVGMMVAIDHLCVLGVGIQPKPQR